MRGQASSWVLIVAFHLAVVSHASAHDPGLSSTTLRLTPNGVHYSVLVNNADLPASRIASASGCEATLVMSGGGGETELPVRDATCRAHGVAHTLFEGGLTLSAGESLDVRLALLDELPRGHRSFGAIVAADGTLLAQRMLRREVGALRVHSTGRASEAAEASGTNFFELGLEHILTGFDHLLFLVLLLLGSSRWGSMLATVSCFTLAHSVTLLLSTLDWVRLPAAWVEPLIALTVVYVGARQLASRQRHAERMSTVALFGLLHGLGFAAALKDLGVGAQVLRPLFAFNLGVEVGQLIIALGVFPLLLRLQVGPGLPSTRWQLHGSRGISGVATCVAAFWFIERLWGQ